MRVPHRCLERPVWIGRERGIALLALLALVGLGAAIALLAMANPLPGELRREEVTRKALAKAKEALIAYATTYGDEHPGQVPGYLPCPDLGAAGIGGEGGAEASCGAANTTIIGRLPWKTLGIEPLRDGYGECLWYAVSGTFKNNPKTELMNWDTLGQIEVYASDGISLIAGSQPEDRAAAVIFAPGVALGQDRQDDDPGTPQRPVCSEDYTAARFLEASGAYSNAVANATAGAVSRFIAAEKADGFNDRLLFLTPAEIFAGVQKRSDFAPKLAGLAQTAAQCLTQYVAANTFYAPGDRRFPWTAPAGLTAYTADGYYDDAANSLSGRYPFQIDTSKAAPVPNALRIDDLRGGLRVPNGWCGRKLVEELEGPPVLCPERRIQARCRDSESRDLRVQLHAGEWQPGQGRRRDLCRKTPVRADPLERHGQGHPRELSGGPQPHESSEHWW